MTLPIASMLAGLFALMMVPLSAQVSIARLHAGMVAFGDGGDETLRRRMRAHGNFIEYAPTALIAVGLMELGGAGPALVGTLAAAFLVSRVLHAVGMLYASTPVLQGIGMVVQHLAFLAAGAWLVVAAVGHG
jgi:hypothetical protein